MRAAPTLLWRFLFGVGDHVGDEARLVVVEHAGLKALAQPLNEGTLGGSENA